MVGYPSGRRERIANPLIVGSNPTLTSIYVLGVNGSITVSKTEGKGSNPLGRAKNVL